MVRSQTMKKPNPFAKMMKMEKKESKKNSKASKMDKKIDKMMGKKKKAC